jgi:hypothetical protein
MESALGARFEGSITGCVEMEEGSGNPINQNGYLYPAFERAHRLFLSEVYFMGSGIRAKNQGLGFRDWELAKP